MTLWCVYFLLNFWVLAFLTRIKYGTIIVIIAAHIVIISCIVVVCPVVYAAYHESTTIRFNPIIERVVLKWLMPIFVIA